MFFYELHLLKQQNNQVHILKLNVLAHEFAPYKFSISNCPIKIFIYFLRTAVREMTRSQQGSGFFQLLEWHRAFLGKIECSLQADSPDCRTHWSSALGDGTKSLPPRCKRRGLRALGECPSHGPRGQALLVHAGHGFGRAVDHLPARHAGERQVPVSPRHVH